MTWVVDMDAAVRIWLRGLDTDTYEHVMAAVVVLSQEGPGLGRPLVDTVEDSRYPNMKELRPSAPGKQTLRILFAFDPIRQAFLLVAGDKTNHWKQWYRVNIPVADERYEKHLNELKEPKQ
jgi:hypothetical protein